ncbi:MAG: Uncharacterised protein [SAR92 bacterium MED-G29]|nr:MAG: Uncharacterised protein [SAR92 bacterium MED-G29]
MPSGVCHSKSSGDAPLRSLVASCSQSFTDGFLFSAITLSIKNDYNIFIDRTMPHSDN